MEREKRGREKEGDRGREGDKRNMKGLKLCRHIEGGPGVGLHDVLQNSKRCSNISKPICGHLLYTYLIQDRQK